MLDQVLPVFGVEPDFDLDLMQPSQTLSALTGRVLTGVESVLEREAPDLAVVQGDTTTTLAAALAAFYRRIPVAHVEAGLRTGDMAQPFPEEMNRVLTARLAAIHFAPTVRAAEALASEGICRDRIFVTGNTGIDAVLYVRDRLEAGETTYPWPWRDASKHLILLTCHRRENIGSGFENAMRAIRQLADRPDVQVAYPVHRNPAAAEAAFRFLHGHPNVLLMDPLPYVPFIDLTRQCRLILTDSGGIQEEAPSLGKPVLVLRNKTERPEAVEAGTVRLVGTDEGRIFDEASRLLDDDDAYARMARIHNPYGDGRACERIAAVLAAQAGR
jgi:UDP-N-acetylglucosamine 2-epimerase (non-hydrolysing)